MEREREREKKERGKKREEEREREGKKREEKLLIIAKNKPAFIFLRWIPFCSCHRTRCLGTSVDSLFIKKEREKKRREEEKRSREQDMEKDKKKRKNMRSLRSKTKIFFIDMVFHCHVWFKLIPKKKEKKERKRRKKDQIN